MVRRRIGVEERRARLASRHHLHRGFPAASPVEAARQQVGLHSSDPATVFLSLWARMDGLKVSDIEACLYEQPSIFRILGMRRTLFAVPVDLIPLLHHGCALSLAAAERRRLVGYLEGEGITENGTRWLQEVENATVESILRRGEALATELREDVPELKETLTFGMGRKWGGKVGVSTRVLFLLATEGRILRGRPRGTLAECPVPMGCHGIPAPRRHSRSGSGRRSDPTRGGLAPHLRPRDRGRSQVVDRMASAQSATSTGRLGSGGSGSQHGTGMGNGRRSQPDPLPTAVGGPIAGTRSDRNGMAGTPLVPRGAVGWTLRPQRQRQAHRLVVRPSGGLLGTATRREGGLRG